MTRHGRGRVSTRPPVATLLSEYKTTELQTETDWHIAISTVDYIHTVTHIHHRHHRAVSATIK